MGELTTVGPNALPGSYWGILIFALIVLACFLVGIQFLFLHVTRIYKNLRQEIRYSVTPKFLELNVGGKQIVDLAIEVWRLENRITRSQDKLSDADKTAFKHSFIKLKRFLEVNDIEVKDHTNEKYNEGLNYELISVEKDESAKESRIKETVEPTVLCKGQVVNRAKVVLIEAQG